MPSAKNTKQRATKPASGTASSAPDQSKTASPTTTPLSKEQLVFNTTRFDLEDFSALKTVSKPLTQTEKTGANKMGTFPQLLADINTSLIKRLPIENAAVEAAYEVNRAIMDIARKTPEWETLRGYTIDDQHASILATNTIAKHVLDNLPKELAQKANEALALQKRRNELTREHDRISALIEDADQLRLSAEQQAALKADLNATEAAAAKTDAALNKASKAAAQAALDHEEIIRRSTRGAAAQAAHQSAEEAEQMAAWGSEPGQPTRIPLDTKMKLADRLKKSDKLRRLALMAGRYQSIALSTRRNRVKHGADEICDIEQGSDLSRILPSELILLANKITKRLFLKKFSQGELLQYALESREKLIRGPIVINIDSSGSMSGEREIWAKAIAMGLVSLAKLDRRDLAVNHFGSSKEIKTFVFKKGKFAPVELADCMEYFLGGGTDFERPLKEALSQIESSQFARADVIHITDGECAVSEPFLKTYNEVKSKKGFSTYTVLVGNETRSDTVSLFSDRVIHIDDLQNDKDVTDMVFSIPEN